MEGWQLLPNVVKAKSIQPFKFWLNGGLQDGVHFQNELYYRLNQASITSRNHIYQLACKLTQHGADVFISIDDECLSLWANLRNQKVAAFSLSNKLSLPSTDNLLP
jgi:hypothetical protein